LARRLRLLVFKGVGVSERRKREMTELCLVVADGGRARFFTLEPVELPELESGPNLIEHEDMLNPEGKITPGDLFTESRTGLGWADSGGPTHGFDDHRDQHQDEITRRFARLVAEKTAQIVKARRAERVILAAPARMTGFLRKEMNRLDVRGTQVDTLVKDITRLSPTRIHDHLAEKEILPPRKIRPGPRASR